MYNSQLIPPLYSLRKDVLTKYQKDTVLAVFSFTTTIKMRIFISLRNKKQHFIYRYERFVKALLTFV